jgi:hypothetical protein
MSTEKPTRPEWMNDEQYVIYSELRRTSTASFEALVAKDRETWLDLSLRLRDITRLAHDKMFS